MPKQVVLIHTVPPLIEVFSRLGREILPETAMLHVLDEPLLERVRQHGGIQDEDVSRLRSHVDAAASIGAEAVLVTCSTVSQAVDAVRVGAPIPVLKIDEAMAAEAVDCGWRIGVVATNQTTLHPTQATLMEAAQRECKTVKVKLHYVGGALAALLAGDVSTHDALVVDAIRELAAQSDVLVLAQASMARVLGAAGLVGLGKPVLASPRPALEQLRSQLSLSTGREPVLGEQR